MRAILHWYLARVTRQARSYDGAGGRGLNDWCDYRPAHKAGMRGMKIPGFGQACWRHTAALWRDWEKALGQEHPEAWRLWLPASHD
jgi:hypothetical protein